MPKVGKQKFPYTSAGTQKAQKHAKATGQKVDMSGYKRGGSPRPSTKTVKTNWQAKATGRGKSLPNIGKPTPQSGGRTARKGSSLAGLSGYKHPKGIGTHRLSSTAEKKLAHSDAWYKDSPKKNRPGQKSSVQKAGTRAMQRAGVRSDAYVGKPTPQSGGRERSWSGYKPPASFGHKTKKTPPPKEATHPSGLSKRSGWGTSKLGINKKKGGAVKKKYHHGGRVMGGQKKPKNQKC